MKELTRGELLAYLVAWYWNSHRQQKPCVYDPKCSDALQQISELIKNKPEGK